MNIETIFRVTLPFLILAFAAHREYYIHRHGVEENTLKKRTDGICSAAMGTSYAGQELE
jgi:hypothetical protein